MIAGDTGIPLTQRAQSFVLTLQHPNQLAPHKRPRAVYLLESLPRNAMGKVLKKELAAATPFGR